MSNKRWASDDKIQLMKLYSGGKSYEEIGHELGRSPNAIKLRLESIVYDNLVRGKPVSMLIRMLDTDQETIKQFYYSHKSFRQSRNESVEDVVFADVEQHTHRQLGGGSHFSGMDSNKRHSVIKSSYDHENDKKFADVNIESLKVENKVLDELIKNYRMKRQVRKLYVDGKLDDKSIDLYEKLLKSSKK
jgi:hypothetical protein